MLNFEESINRIEFKPIEGHLGINSRGHLTICDNDVVELAEEYGTPLFVFNEDKIRSNYRAIKSAFKKYYDNVEICFAYKANSLLAVARILDQEGAYADVVSGGELYKTQLLGVDPKKVVFNGNNKLRHELETAIQLGVIINVDSLNELEMIAQEVNSLEKPANICFRVNPNVSTEVIDEFATGIKKSKFGLDIENGEAFEAYKQAKNMPFCNILGVHTHIGSQIETSGFYAVAAEKIMDFCGKLKSDLNIDLKFINMGGGFAIPFDYLEKCSSIDDFAQAITSVVSKKINEYSLKPPTILIEPGGSIIGNTAIALFKVGTVKQRQNKKLAALDGGADILLRATQGWYTFRALCANKMLERPVDIYDLVGPLCYEGDILARDRKMPALNEDDVIAFIDVGAYTVVLMNHYNCRPLPAIILVNNRGAKEVIRRRERYEDLLLHEYVPERLNKS